MATSTIHGTAALGQTVAGAGRDALRTLITEALPPMDPRLQRAMVLRRHGAASRVSARGAVDEIAVVAKVSDLAAWDSMSEVRLGTTISRGRDGDPTRPSIVTARVPVARLDHIRQQPCVVSLKAARLITPALDATTEETEARPALLPAGHATNGGAGVLVGVVDFGCDFAHRNLMTSGNKTRLEAIWDQGGTHTPGSSVAYGRLFERPAIDAAIRTTDPYTTLGYGPQPDVPGRPPGSHGTHVIDIAAGNGRGSGIAGVAPKSDLIFVELAADDIPWEGDAAVGKSFGDSVQLLEAVRFIFDRAGTRPCVVNLSLGTNGGPHDGTTLVEEGFDRMLREADNRAIVIAASNSFSDGIHAAGRVNAAETVDLRWRVPVSDVSGNEIEIWYAGADRFTCELVAPDGEVVLSVGPGDNQSLALGSQIVVFASSRLDDPNNHDNMIGIFLERDLPPGDWAIRLRGDVVQDGRFHAWIERDDRRPSQFVPADDNSHTLGSISTGLETIAVGSSRRAQGREASLVLLECGTDSGWPAQARSLGARACRRRRALTHAHRRHHQIGHEHGGPLRGRPGGADPGAGTLAEPQPDDPRDPSGGHDHCPTRTARGPRLGSALRVRAGLGEKRRVLGGAERAGTGRPHRTGRAAGASARAAAASSRSRAR